jgi:undecaprenyl diphosphate synthase
MTKKAHTNLNHIAIIMDGNRRWAKQNKLKALQGHAYVTNHVIEPLVDRCIELKIPYLTLWAFSTENWNRESSEVEGLMKLFRQAFAKNAQDLHQKGVKLNMIGDMSKFPADIQKGVQYWIDLSRQNTKITVTFALNYGGRDEILRAIDKADQAGANFSNLTQDEFGQFLDTRNIPDPDLIIRTGGEQRLSGYLPWQAVYSELYFTRTFMPDFSPVELDKALEEFQNRQRRFGK